MTTHVNCVQLKPLSLVHNLRKAVWRVATRNRKSIQNDLDARRDARIDPESIQALRGVATDV